MTTGMTEIREALVARLGVIPDFDARPYIPDSINVPGCFVEPDRPFVDYAIVFQTGQLKWNFQLTVLASRLDEPSAQNALDDLMHPFGPLVGALQSMEIEDDLSELISYVNVLQATRYGAYEIGGTTYLGAQLSIEVCA